MDVSDGTRAPNGTIKWTRVATSTDRVKFREIRMAPARIRYIRTPFQDLENSLTYIGFTEVMLYGEGYVPEVALTSELIRLGDRKNLISMNWEADTPPGTRVQMQTRTGNELDEDKIYHDSKGNIVSEKAFNRLPSVRQGEISTTLKIGGDWSSWSPPYRRSGEVIQSPSPREYMEIRAQILSERPDAAAFLRSVAVEFSDPVASQLVGEVWPNRAEIVGRPEEFSFFLRPFFDRPGQQFDEIRIAVTAGAQIDELLEVRLGSAADFRDGTATLLSPAAVTLRQTPADTLWFHLAEKVGQGVEVVEVRFRSTIFSNSASFDASVRDADRSEFWQRVDAGQAVEAADSQTTAVLALGGNQVVRDVRLEPEVMTPNGDGVNDAMVFGFSIARIDRAGEVSVTIRDLSGAMVARLSERRPDPRGRYAIAWSGNDASGRRVPPGIYLARIAVDAEAATDTSVDRLVHVAY